ncbi:hypothetical protein BS17DRAFT_780726 [Gyrodon lividus]|nr:hypothetical protein BS17DRAFT_780726 [Gyrodon lividus]
MAILLEIITSILTSAIAIPGASVDGTCLVVDTPLMIISMIVGLTVSQSILLYLTYRRKPVMSPNATGRSNIVSIVIRDGAFAFGSLTSRFGR